MERKRVTTEMLRRMAKGETRVFELPDAAAINSAKSNAYRLAPILQCRFCAKSDFKNNRLTITRLPYDKK